MSEDRDEALMRSLFAGGAAPMGDERFVAAVMTRVGDDAAKRQARVTGLIWAGGAAAAFLGATNFTAIVAELSRAFAAAEWSLPALSGGGAMLALVALAAGGAYVFSERT